jgi:hypothetical protein
MGVLLFGQVIFFAHYNKETEVVQKPDPREGESI